MPLSPDGTFATSPTASLNNIGVATNHYTGYTLGISASTSGNNALVNTATSGTIPSITTPVSEANYRDDTYALSNNLNNTWGYRPSTLYNTTTGVTESNSNYLPAPTSSTEQVILAKTTTANTTTNYYSVALGARVTAGTVPGSYENTFVITVVANQIPYTITYDANAGSDTTTNMPVDIDSATVDTSIPISSNVPIREGYRFMGWCTTPVADDGTCSAPNVEYSAGGDYIMDQVTNDNDVELYAMWATNKTATFSVGSGIETIIVTEKATLTSGGELAGNPEPFYATNSNSLTLTDLIPGTEYIVTVVPEANYRLGVWNSVTGGTSRLSSAELLTTTYTVGNVNDTFVALGESGSYTSMQNFNACTAEGDNVTDVRNGKSYTVAEVGGYCYMLSNLRLESGVAITSVTSDVTDDTFTLPDQTAWTSSTQNNRCEAQMSYTNNEYYYNLSAAIANPTTGSSGDLSSCTGETIEASLGSICPSGWTIADYVRNIFRDALLGVGTNAGMLTATGYYDGDSQVGFGSVGQWWGFLYSTPFGYGVLDSNGFHDAAGYDDYGRSIRCIRTE